MSWLLAREVFPLYMYGAAPGAQGGLDIVLADPERWMRILHEGKTVGWIRRSVDLRDDAGKRSYILRDQMVVFLRVLGRTVRAAGACESSLDIWGRLVSLDAKATAADAHVRVRAERGSDGRFRALIEGIPGFSEMTVEIPDDALPDLLGVGWPLGQLRPGQRRAIRAINLFRLQPETVWVEATGYETIRWQNHDVRALALRATFAGWPIRIWVDEQGRILRQTSATGWVLERCEPGEIDPQDYLPATRVMAEWWTRWLEAGSEVLQHDRAEGR